MGAAVVFAPIPRPTAIAGTAPAVALRLHPPSILAQNGDDRLRSSPTAGIFLDAEGRGEGSPVASFNV